MENTAKNSLVIIDTNRYVTQKQYCDQKGISPQALQNMITRNQIAKLHIAEFGLTLIDTQADAKESIEIELPRAIVSREQIGDFMAEWTVKTALKNQELQSLVTKQLCELTKQSEVIKQNDYAIEELAYINNDFREKLKNLMNELQIKDCLVTKQQSELTKQSELITQNSLVITQLEQKSKDLESKNIDLEAEIAVLKSSNSNLAEKLELAKEKAIFQTEKIQSLTQELNSGLMSKLVELVSKQNSTEQV
jgi:hypothetical protein